MRDKVVQKVEANKRSLDQEWRQSQKKLSMEVFKDNPLLEERKKEVWDWVREKQLEYEQKSKFLKERRLQVEIEEEMGILRTFEKIENKMARSERNFHERIREKSEWALSFHENQEAKLNKYYQLLENHFKTNFEKYVHKEEKRH